MRLHVQVGHGGARAWARGVGGARAHELRRALHAARSTRAAARRARDIRRQGTGTTQDYIFQISTFDRKKVFKQ